MQNLNTASVEGPSAQSSLEGPASGWHYATGRLRRILTLNDIASSASRGLHDWSTLEACSLWRQCKSVFGRVLLFKAAFVCHKMKFPKLLPCLRHSPRVAPYCSFSSKHSPILTRWDWTL